MIETTREYAMALFSWLQAGDPFLIPDLDGNYEAYRVFTTADICGLPAQIAVRAEGETGTFTMKLCDIMSTNAVAAEPSASLDDREPWRRLRPGLIAIKSNDPERPYINIWSGSPHAIPEGWTVFEFPGDGVAK